MASFFLSLVRPRPSIFCTVVALLATIVIVSTAHAALTAAHPLYMAKRLQYYLHLDFGSQDLAYQFLPPVNTSFTDNFGAANLFAFNITKGQSRTSKALGLVRGFTVETSYIMESSRGLEVASVEYDDGVYKGTIQLQGLVVSSGTEVSIVGGTGSFRGARGFLVVAFIKAVEPHQLYSHQLYFM